MPKVSVIIPCYNLGQYLNEAVDSVLAQTFQDFEIIIVNDGSTDEFTNTLLADYKRPKTRVLTTSNQGLPSARNNGIKISAGDYICCLDADDKYHPEFLEKTVVVLDEDIAHKYGFVTTWIQAFGEESTIWETLDFNPFKLATGNLVHVASLFRKECWEKKGGYSTNLSGYQDWDFWISIVAMGYKWVSIKEPLFYYRVRSHSMIKESDNERVTLYRQIIRNNIDFYSINFEPILASFMEEHGQLNKLYQELNVSYQKLNQYHQALYQSHQELNQSYQKISQYYREMNQSYQELNQSYQKLYQSHQELNHSHQKLIQSMNNILNSYSWKITAPLRVLYRYYYAWTKRLKH